ncbi:coiled-coil domain-containing protein 62 isoform X2 [Poecile atricapillus]|uniref:coiled-coil domain-containing protein 62 isoform X2 n=1 Tax=Poecile atricapillus TaxID=48891 RepID=UPI002738720A|nr:coiled-coil domain-containing protein 62 isoform X2 [Poecile atricapillus]
MRACPGTGAAPPGWCLRAPPQARGGRPRPAEGRLCSLRVGGNGGAAVEPPCGTRHPRRVPASTNAWQSSSPRSPMSSSLLRSVSPQAFSPSHKNSIIRRQRQELKLLIAELKDRDRELNDMVAVHERHIQAWEDDRQRILTLAERCSLLTSELNERNAVIKSLTKKLKLLESQHNDSKITLENTQKKYQELTQKITDSSVHCQALEEKNQSLHCSILELSAKTDQLQAREQELLNMLQLKDKALLETTDQMNEVASKFKTLESVMRTSKLEEFSRNREHQDLKLTLSDVVFQINKMRDVLSEKMKESSKHQEEISHLKQENGCLRSELILAVEEAQRKDQLYQFTKSKQARIEKELSSLRQVCVKQQRDLHFLQVNLDSSQESRQKHEKAASEGHMDLNSLRLDSPLLTSTQKSSVTQSSGKFSDEDSPLDISDLAVTKPTKRYYMNTDTSSLFWKLERSLAQSRQMLADLELSLLHTSPSCIPNTKNMNKRKKLFPTPR